MSTTGSSILSEVESVASSLGTGVIGGVAAAVTEAEKIAEPLVTDAVQHKYEKQKTNYDEELETILSADPIDPAAVGAFCLRLCTDAGYPVGGVGRVIEVPLDCFRAFCAATADDIYQKQQFTDKSK